MTIYEATSKYNEYGYMNLNLGDEESQLNAEEFKEQTEAFVETFDGLTVADIEGRIMHNTPFTILEAVFTKNYGADDEGQLFEYCSNVHLLIEIEE